MFSPEKCITCARGKFSSNKGSSSCEDAPEGSFVAGAGATSYALCEQRFFSSEPGQGECQACPDGRITAGQGAVEELDCVSPEFNFIQGFAAPVFLILFTWQYVLRARFERLAFLRLWRVTYPLMAKTKQLLSMVQLYADKERAERVLQWDQHTIRNRILVMGLFLALLGGATVGVMVEMAAISFKSMILFKGLSLDIPFLEKLEEYWRSIAVQLDIRYIFDLIKPFLGFIQYFADLRIDYSFVNVTCPGASAPYELGTNMVVLGLAVVLIGSDLQVFRAVTLTAYISQKGNIITKMLYLKWHLMHKGDRLTYSFCGGAFAHFRALLVFAAENMAQFDGFQTSLQYIMSLVTVGVFISDNGIHETSVACNSVKGFENFDTYIAIIASTVFYLFLLPFGYEVTKIMMPGLPSYTDADGNLVVLRLDAGKDDADDIDRPEFRKFFGFHRLLKWFSYFSVDIWWAAAIDYSHGIASAHIPMDANLHAPSFAALQERESECGDVTHSKSFYGLPTGAAASRGRILSLKDVDSKLTSVCRERLNLLQQPLEAKFRVLVSNDGNRAMLMYCKKIIGSVHQWDVLQQWDNAVAAAGCIVIRISSSSGSILGAHTYDIYSPQFEDAMLGRASELNAELLKTKDGVDRGSVTLVILLGSKQSNLPTALPDEFFQAADISHGYGKYQAKFPYLLINGRESAMINRHDHAKSCVHSSWSCFSAAPVGMQLDFVVDAANFKNGYEVIENHDIHVKPLQAIFANRSETEVRAWHILNSQRMPSYYALCGMEYKEMKTAAMTCKCGGMWLYALCIIPMLLSLLCGMSHIMTSVGRRGLLIMLYKIVSFLRLCLGIWTDSDVEAFGLHRKVFTASGVWANPNVLLRTKKYGQQVLFDDTRRSEQPTIPYASVAKLKTCLKHKTLEQQIEGDYGFTIYALMAMRAALLQAFPYMSFLSVYTTCTAAYPIYTTSNALNACLLPPWVSKPFDVARRIIEERLEQETEIRKDETRLESHQLDNPEFFEREAVTSSVRGAHGAGDAGDADNAGGASTLATSRIPVPSMTRHLKDEMNFWWHERMGKVVNGMNDRVNEWEVTLLGMHIALTQSRYAMLIVSMMRYVIIVWLLLAHESSHQSLITYSLLFLVPYSAVAYAFPFVIRMGISNYVSDAEVMYSFGWIIIPARFFWSKICLYCMRSQPPSEGIQGSKDVEMAATSSDIHNPVHAGVGVETEMEEDVIPTSN